MKNNILVVAAHPDDEILGCGGSMAKWKKKGHRVHVLILAEGLTSRAKIRDRNKHTKELKNLSLAAHKAAEIIGVDSIKLLDYPDNRMDSVDLLGIVKTVENVVDKIKPNIVITHHSGDLNIDHRIVHQAVLTASRPQPGCSIKSILSFEVPSGTEWQSPVIGQTFIPNWFEDITETKEIKIAALNEYSSEMREWPHARSLKAVESLIKWRGASVGYEAAEAFMLIRKL
ncbi:MAG: GlcNAc-PI de-N-acetylase [Candidatus Marinimicrobia bacterium]|nr:GlcNAc-PI de-N-acetylase [Candidatus Neomarinimicrobiota bacterium]|tara:strand:+ start:27492 stop:28178 length:687 start_codon:yes stop_codon:yes gene_type:complete